MLKRFFLTFWNHRVEFTKYFITGVSGVILDMGSLYALKEYANFSPVVAVVINQAVLVNYVFLLNRYWSFKAHTGMARQQIVRFYILAGFNYIFSIGWMWVLHHDWGVHYLLARLSNIALAVGWNFLLYKYWVYKSDAIVNKTPEFPIRPV